MDSWQPSTAQLARCAAPRKSLRRSGRWGSRFERGLHSGEVEIQDGQIAGIAVHIAARVMALADKGGVLVPGTVRDLVVGSPIRFADRGSHQLEGAFQVSGAYSRSSPSCTEAPISRPAAERLCQWGRSSLQPDPATADRCPQPAETRRTILFGRTFPN